MAAVTGVSGRRRMIRRSTRRNVAIVAILALICGLTVVKRRQYWHPNVTVMTGVALLTGQRMVC